MCYLMKSTDSAVLFCVVFHGFRSRFPSRLILWIQGVALNHPVVNICHSGVCRLPVEQVWVTGVAGLTTEDTFSVDSLKVP